MSLAESIVNVFQRFDDCKRIKNVSSSKTVKPKSQGSLRFFRFCFGSFIRAILPQIYSSFAVRCRSRLIRLNSYQFMNIQNIFYNGFGRLRSGLRFTIFFISVFFTTVFLLTAAILALSVTPFGFTANSLGGYVTQFGVSFVITVFFGWLYGKLFEDLPFRALGCWFTKNWLKDLVFGLILGAVSIGLAAFIALIGGGICFKYNDSAGSAAMLLTLGSSFLIFVAGAAF